MISNPNLVFYACIAKGPTVLAEVSSKEAGIKSLAQRCIQKIPPLHSVFSHTVAERTYTFLIDDSFAYFIIFGEDLAKTESFWLLNRLKCAMEEFLLSGRIKGTDKFTPKCLQSYFGPIFSEIMGMDFASTPSKHSQDPHPSVDSYKGKKTVVAPLLENPNNVLTKKKRASSLEVNGGENKDVEDGVGIGIGMENKVDLVNGLRDFPVSMQKNCGVFYVASGDKQKAKQIWRKHVWVVLMLDLAVCAALFGIWLCVCRGFQCIDG